MSAVLSQDLPGGIKYDPTLVSTLLTLVVPRALVDWAMTQAMPTNTNKTTLLYIRAVNELGRILCDLPAAINPDSLSKYNIPSSYQTILPNPESNAQAI